MYRVNLLFWRLKDKEAFIVCGGQILQRRNMMKVLRNILWGFLIADVLYNIVCIILYIVFDVVEAPGKAAFIMYYFWIAAVICVVIIFGMILFKLKKKCKPERNLIVLLCIYIVLTVMSLCYFWMWNI